MALLAKDFLSPDSESKRKRPTYLPDFRYSDSESDDETKSNKNKKKTPNKVKPSNLKLLY